jgi:hypothetical protein
MEVKKYKFKTIELTPEDPDFWILLEGFGVDWS